MARCGSGDLLIVVVLYFGLNFVAEGCETLASLSTMIGGSLVSRLATLDLKSYLTNDMLWD